MCSTSTSAVVTSKLVHNLVSKVVNNQDRTPDIHAYCMRVLGSRMSLALDVEEFRLVELLKIKIMKETGDAGKGYRFAELYNDLCKKSVLNKRWCVLYLLYSLSMSKVSVVIAF